MGKKKSDNEGAFACATCHAEIDRLPSINHVVHFEDAIKLLKFHDAIFRTQEILLKEGLIKIGK